MKIYRLLILVLSPLLAAILGISCSDEMSQTYSEEYTSLQESIGPNNLLLKIEKSTEEAVLTFENGSLSIPMDALASIDCDDDNWNTTLVWNDGSILFVPTLGKSLHLTENNIKVNPTGYAPCSMQLTVSFPVEGKLKVCVKGKHGPHGDMPNLFSKYGYNHQEYIHGLYRDYENTVEVTFVSSAGNELLTEQIKVKTSTPEDLVPDFFPGIQLVKGQPEKMEPGVTIVQDQGGGEYDAHRVYMLDSDGEVRWYLWLRNHPELNVCAHCGFARMKNGNFVTGDARLGNLFELDMVGNYVRKWDISSLGYVFHHEVTEMPNGNLLATVTKSNSKNENNGYIRFDYVIEVDRESGKIVTEWDLKKSMDPKRSVMLSEQDLGDFSHNWAHGNAVAYSASDDCILVSTRYQGLVKLTRDNRLIWFLTPHQEVSKVANALLTPLNGAGVAISDTDILAGKVAHEDFDWVWGAHCPVILENGHILIFDNGYHRHFEEIDLYSQVGYSRAVEYEIDEKNMTVRQVWEYGHKELGRQGYAVAVSSVQFLPETNHIMFCPGVGTFTVNGSGGKIMEVDYVTKERVYEVHLARPGTVVFHRAHRVPLYPNKE